jgi:CRP/FNR family nitrogen fixation transcriptional regulator
MIAEDNLMAFAGSAIPTPTYLGLLPTAGALRHYSQHQGIFGEGDDADSYLQVVSGVVRTCRFLSGGRRQIDSFHLPGDLFGLEMGVQRRLCAEAASPATIIVYRHLSLEALAANDEPTAFRLFEQAIRSLARAQDHAVLLGRRTATERVAAFLIDWATHFAPHEDVILAMTRQDIADYLGLTVETVSRTLANMEKHDVIELCTARWVRLTNPAALQAMAS